MNEQNLNESIQFLKSKIKLEIALVRGKKKADKRETIKKRDSKRMIDRLLKRS